ncbi:MAG: ThiF family adenylyltransferase [Bacteroidaceae bacterium]|nr:ThiF family adenylyltransferase [Bacteroidaceae bacterium]
MTAEHSIFQRMELILGAENIRQLSSKCVMIVGIGGVGGYAAELVVRSGVGSVVIVDGDIVEEGNINRQIIALHSTIGRSKTAVMEQRLTDINPDVHITAIDRFIKPEDVAGLIGNNPADIIIDAIDSVQTKAELIRYAFSSNIPIISSMGAGKRTLAEKVMITTLDKTHHDGLSKAVRRAVNNNEICRNLKVVFSSQEPVGQSDSTPVIGSISYIPATFGIYLAQYTINYLLNL